MSANFGSAMTWRPSKPLRSKSTFAISRAFSYTSVLSRVSSRKCARAILRAQACGSKRASCFAQLLRAGCGVHIALRKTTLQVARTSKGARTSSGDLLVARLCATFKRSVCGVSVQSLKRSLGGMSLCNSQQISWWNVPVQSLRRSLGGMCLCNPSGELLVTCLCEISQAISWWHVSVQSLRRSLGGISLCNSQTIFWWHVSVKSLRRSLGGISLCNPSGNLLVTSLRNLSSDPLVACLCAISQAISWSWWHVAVQSLRRSLGGIALRNLSGDLVVTVQSLRRSLGGISLCNTQTIFWWHLCAIFQAISW